MTLLLVLAWASNIHLGSPLILILLVGGVVILGLPHGALDPLVATQLWGRRKSFTKARFALMYAGTAVLCAMLWITAPNTALIVFLCISAYHFGSDWDGRSGLLGRSAFGLSVICVSTLRKADQVEGIYKQLGASGGHQIVMVSQVLAVVALLAALLMASSKFRFRISNLSELATVAIGGLFLPPLLFFTCYFCLLHSPRHLIHTAHSLGLKRFRDIARSAAPTLLGTLVLGAGLWGVLPGSIYSQRVIQLVFIGLAALTAPHMLVTEINRRHSLHLAEGGHKDLKSIG